MRSRGFVTFNPWIAGPWLLTVGFVLLPMLAVSGARAEALDPSTLVTVHSAFGFQLPPSYPSIVVTGVQIQDVSPSPIRLGRFNGSGKVVDGDVVLVAFLHLGSAPVAKIVLPATNGTKGTTVTEDRPVRSGITNTSGFVLPPDFTGVEPQFPAGTAPDGAEGEFFIALALLERRNQRLTEALGVTVPYRVRIAEPQGFLQGPDGALFFERRMTRGGAAQFRRFEHEEDHDEADD